MLICMLPGPRLKYLGRKYIYTAVMRINLRPYSSVLRFHNTRNRPKPNSVVVANHTTPIDYAVLCSDVAYSAIGQVHEGFFGVVERMLAKAIPTVWFDRSEVLDRTRTTEKLKQHVNTEGNPPLLVFPEGTCINNTSVMKFKKGAFEIDAVIYPLTIMYDPRFADCFWNSSVDSLLQYMIKLMTSWAMVVDVWYLPPQQRRANEDGSSFARRVRQMIAECGGLVDMEWDGDLKRKKPKDAFKESQQRLYTKYLKTQ
ncbi:1-acylglycerol-3-phosphate O-acyltransferase 6 (lysophosphatidic acid acyltransferase, zeta) [Cichlidogyrus casuarinus]|uniref:1-acylglycerol-3-phosphate O-acyltransferase 6 (Lysophosphatidic acid acyltransferase, zeta) n=1 Tax=Cichlidogyrus casuarinus TaxID=1844966 RepID=A0ABD2Q8J0_9PLAT